MFGFLAKKWNHFFFFFYIYAKKKFRATQPNKIAQVSALNLEKKKEKWKYYQSRWISHHLFFVGMKWRLLRKMKGVEVSTKINNESKLGPFQFLIRLLSPLNPRNFYQKVALSLINDNFKGVSNAGTQKTMPLY